MIAAFWPLPPDPRQMQERDHGAYGVPETFKRQLAVADEVRYQSAVWWRTLNRCMSLVGLLLLGTVAALVVLGIRQGWIASP